MYEGTVIVTAWLVALKVGLMLGNSFTDRIEAKERKNTRAREARQALLNERGNSKARRVEEWGKDA